MAIPAAREPETEPAGTPARPATPSLVADERVLELQRTAGNRAVARMVAGERRLARLRDGPRARFLRSALAQAVADSDWAAAVSNLKDFDDTEAVQRLKAMSGEAIEAIAAQADDDTDAATYRIYRLARFALNDPGAVTAHRLDYSITDVGTLADEEHVGGGLVRVRTDSEMKMGTSDYTPGFMFTYSGANSARSRWLQFIWREIVVEHPLVGTYRVDQAITTTGGTYRLTTDPADPHYNTDSAAPASPFYETGGASRRTAEATNMFDMPAPMDAVVQAQWALGATSVTSRAHFSTYLVRDWRVLYRGDLDIEWAYADRTVPTRTQTLSSGGPATALEPGQRDRLVEQYPDFDYLP